MELSENDVHGQSVTFFVVARWIAAVRRGRFTGAPELAAVDWVGRHLGADLAAATRRAAETICVPGENHDPVGAGLVPALVWLATDLTAEYGDGDPGRLNRHTETGVALHTGCLPPRRPL